MTSIDLTLHIGIERPIRYTSAVLNRLHSKPLLCCLLTAMVLRSLIAVGFMLDTQPPDGAWVSVKICPGPGGINAIAGLNAEQSHHHQHQGQGQGQGEKHDHSAQDHSFTGCSFWSASGVALSTYDAGNVTATDAFLYATSRYRNPSRAFELPRAGKAREPPILS